MHNPHLSVFQFQRSLIARQLSPLKSPPVLGLLKSQSLCVLPGAGGAWRNADSTVRGECLNRRLTTSNCSLREAVCTGHDSGDSTGAGSHNSAGTSEEGIAVGDLFFFIKCFAVQLNGIFLHSSLLLGLVSVNTSIGAGLTETVLQHI